MPIETECLGCGKRLRVADEHAGKLAKCPQCQTVYTVPQSPVAASWGAGASTSSSLAPSDRWHLKTVDGLTFGPVSRGELDRWMTEGRVTPQSQILHEGDGQWQWAGQIYPHLQNMAADSPFAPGASAAAIPSGGINPYAPSQATAPYGAGYPRFQEPHRGGAILTISVLSIFCSILAIAVLVMAIMDLSKMNRGVMDPAGRGLTIAGLVIACLPLLLIVVQILSAFAN
jgi:hypothetical protein